MKSDQELSKDDPELFRVARQGATEAPFSSPYLQVDGEGIFHCAICNTPLFKTDKKFDSGTGWPSFTEPVSEGVVTMHPDYTHGMVRTEVKCATCGAHLGHVFPDGPRREDGTRENRYCINGICLDLEQSA